MRLLVALTMAVVPVVAQTIGGCPVFPSNNVWNARVDALPVHSRSANWVQSIGALATLHQDFGGTPHNGVEPGIPVNLVDATQRRVPIQINEGFDESDPGPYPFPPAARVEGGSDRHVIVVDTANCMLYETFYSFKNADDSWTVSSGAIFNLRRNLLRPPGWTSADAAGLPILPGLLRYEEIAQGEIRHALRFTAPRTVRSFLWPARHQASYSEDLSLPPMGARFRLKANFDISGFSQPTRIILTALKRYGMMVADNGGAWYVQGTFDERWPDLADEWRRIPGSALEAVDAASLIETEDSAAVRGVTAVPILNDVSVSANSLTAGQTVVVTVRLMSPAPSGGATVDLLFHSLVHPNVRLSVPAGQISASVPVVARADFSPVFEIVTASLSGMTRTARFTVTPYVIRRAPELGPLTPSSGSGDVASFTLRVTDYDNDVARVDLWVGRTLDVGCHVVHSGATVYLRNDDGSWLSAVPGSSTVLSNSRCSLDAAQARRLYQWRFVDITISLRFAPEMRGSLTVFGRAWDHSGLDTSWQVVGRWAVGSAAAPAIARVVPANGAGETANFAATVTDTDGASDVVRLDLLVGASLDATNCHVSYNLASGLVYLRSADGSWQAASAGRTGLLSQPRCSLDASQVFGKVSGNSLTANFPIRLNAPSFGGTQNVYLRAYDQAGLDSNWIPAGVWTVGAQRSIPMILGISPAAGTGVTASFAMSVSDVAGAGALDLIALHTGPSVDSGCTMLYNVAFNTLYVRASGGNWLQGTPGASSTLATSHCDLDLRETAVTVSEPVMKLTLPFRFADPMVGNNNVYMRAINRMGGDSEWRAAGRWVR